MGEPAEMNQLIMGEHTGTHRSVKNRNLPTTRFVAAFSAVPVRGAQRRRCRLPRPTLSSQGDFNIAAEFGMGNFRGYPPVTF